MSFSWPLVLAGLSIIPLLIGVYAWLQRRRRRFAVRYASLSLIREALPKRAWRRHVPFALYLLSLAALTVAAARPQATVDVPTKRASIILTLDVSLSMCSSDVPPDRLSVAEDVARRFIKEQPSDTRIGLVAFAGLAQLVVPPTTDHDQLTRAIAGLRVSRGTAIGSALLKAVDAIAEINPHVSRSDVSGSQTTPAPTPASGDYQPDIIVLLTDGAATQGVDPLVAAKQAGERRVRVYTIGFGTTNPAPLACSPERLGSDVLPNQFGGGGAGFGGGQPGNQGGRRRALVVDEDALKGIADATGGTYHQAQDADQLKKVFSELPNEVTVQTEEREVSVVFVAIGGLAVIAAIGLSLLWNRYP